ncbi:LLM class F420-dependent oxidoreductase [Minwuia sp.]|uniref:LLM class F420-dependent oxidoreductase n=1 Tax=Minwuia sp. TaxID=2493630 RepID=UPI003A950FF4
MKFGMRYCNTSAYTDAAKAVELAEAAEEAGFDSLWTVEHTIVPKDYQPNYPYAQGGKMAGGAEDIPLPDPLIWMAYVAARTSTIKLATGILILPQHNAVHVAKQVATLDALSNGRIILGIGVGWMEEEFRVLNANFAERGPRTDDAIRALRVLWSDSPAEYHGTHIDFDPLYCEPRPVNRHVPIIVGGHSKAAARRAGRLGDGFFPARDAPADLIALTKQTAAEVGRDPAEIEITVSMPDDPAELNALAAAGVDRVAVPVTSMAGLNTAITSPEDALTWKQRIADFSGN